MWSVVLKILSILGIILLILLGVALAAVLLVLFMPVVYRGSGSAREGVYRGRFRFRWLFGLVRGEFAYPEDGALRIKMLWLTIYDSGGKQPDTGTEPAEDAETGKASHHGAEPEGKAEISWDTLELEGQPEVSQGAVEQPKGQPEISQDTAGLEKKAEASKDAVELEKKAEAPQDAVRAKEKTEAAPAKGLFAKLSALKEKLQPFLAIVRDEDNQALVRHALGRLGKILKGIRPRVLRLDALIGLGEPDITGYVYGVCWAIKPFFGRKCRIAITPDFERQVLEGEVFLRGHIMGAVLLHHIVRVILDKRLWQLVDQLKKIQDDIKK